MHSTKFVVVLVMLSVFADLNYSFAQNTVHMPGEFIQNIPPMRKRVEIMERWWKWKKEHAVPQIMLEQNIDMWIIRNNEAELYYNNEGPVYTSLIPANYEGMALPGVHEPAGSQWAARFMMFYNDGTGVKYIEPENYDSIKELVITYDPQTIAIGELDNEEMLQTLGKKYASRSVGSQTLGMRWLETMAPEQIRMYRWVQKVHNDLIAEGLSNKVIIPDVTTTNDLNWWFRHRMLDLNLEHENHPSVQVQRRPELIEKYDNTAEYFATGKTGNGIDIVIRRGDIVGVDTDIMLLGLVTDTKRFAYVLQDGEEDVPEDLQEALNTVNRLHATFAKEFKIGRTGKEIFDAAQKIPREEVILTTTMVFHPPPMFIRRFLQGGFMFSNQSYLAGMTSSPVNYPTAIVSHSHKLYNNTLFSLDPAPTRVAAREWGVNGIEILLGDVYVYTEKGLEHLDGPMTGWYVIR